MRDRPAAWLGWFALAAVLAWSYASPILAVVGRWWSEPDYLHGFLVPPFALFLLWMRRRMLLDATWAGSRWGLALLAVCAGMRWASSYFYYELLEPLSLVACLAGLVLWLGGWGAIRWAWPAIAMLVFMVPLPGFIAERFSHPLQRLNTVMSLYVIQTLGIPGAAHGNILVLAHGQLGVAEACNGLRMMPLFAAVSVGAALLMRLSPVEKAIVLLGTFPVAVLANVIRIVLTVVMLEMVSAKLGTAFFHDLAGWFMMPLAVGLLWLELALLKRLFLPPPSLASATAD
ncbi:MAG: exosortase/archaeosortase family protein [Thermoguttaceae bacterium]|jgi:exosortase